MGLRLLILALALAGCADVTVLDPVSEVDAHRAVASLERAGVAARFEALANTAQRRQFRVSVAPSQASRAVSTLHDLGLPRREQPGFDEAWGERSLVMTRAEERARAAQATAGELSRSLEAIDGVVMARVHVAPGSDPELATDTPRRPAASVLIQHASATPPLDEQRVRALVASAVDGMRPEEVAVIFAQRAAAVTAVTRPRSIGSVVITEGYETLRATLAAMLVVIIALTASVMRLMRERATRRG